MLAAGTPYTHVGAHLYHQGLGVGELAPCMRGSLRHASEKSALPVRTASSETRGGFEVSDVR